MTDFEQQVAEALNRALDCDERVRDGYSKHFAVVVLAPHVAAAIEVALRADGVHPGAYEAALRELRADDAKLDQEKT